MVLLMAVAVADQVMVPLELEEMVAEVLEQTVIMEHPALLELVVAEGPTGVMVRLVIPEALADTE